MSCPDEKTLTHLVLGQLPDQEAEELARHLETCDRCAATVHSRPSNDTLVAAARAKTRPETESERNTVDALIGRLSEMVAPQLAPLPRERIVASDAVNQASALAALLMPALQPDELGRLGPYRVLKVLGAGGMGIVFLAEDPTLKRQVALKTLQPAIATNPAARERFLREARAVAALEDERIVPIYQVGEDRGIPFFAMQFLRGQSLEDRLRDVEAATGSRMLPLAEAVHIAGETARGLAAAHARGVIHRDIKPANIFLVGCVESSEPARSQHRVGPKDSAYPLPTTTPVKLLDFGLARGIDDATAFTQPGSVPGTPAYVAPELLTGAKPNERCDLFGLGCVLYRMATGRMPPGAADARDPVAPSELNPAIAPELAELVLQLVNRDPASRPLSAAAVAERLADIGDGLSSISVVPSRPPRRPWRWRAAAALVAAALLVGLASVYWIRTDRGEFVIEIDDPDVAVTLAQTAGITLHDRKTDRTYVLGVGKHELPTGEYEIDVRELATKLEFSTPRFAIQRGDQEKVIVSLRGQQRAWLNYVAALPAQKQLDAVAQKLRDLNPGFKGEVGPRIEDGKVVEAHIFTDHVTDISPFRALVDLEILVVRGSAPSKGILEDIAPVRSLKHLRYLDFSANRVRHLTPLRGMTLTELSCWANPIRDLTPLRGMPLKMLEVNYTYASDLWPLHGMPLQRLHVSTHYASDLTPLAGLPLVELHCRFRPARHPQVLRSIKSLAKINDRPVAEFWKEHDDRQAAIEPWIKRATTLSAKEQVREVTAKLRQLNPGLEQYVNSKIEDGEVRELSFQTDNVTDITPIRALTKLRLLGVSGSKPGKPYEAKFYDLDPLRDLPIAHLQVANTAVGDLSYLPTKLQVLICSHTPVRDLRPLQAYPLFYLDCSGTLVDDLSPLRSMNIGHLFVKNARLKDLSPLAGLTIHELQADLEPARDTEVLRSIKALNKINDKPAVEFWKEFRSQ